MTSETSRERMPEALGSQLIAFIRHELLDPGTTINREDGLLSGEIIDSMGVLRRSAFVQDLFKVAMQPSDFVVEDFQNESALVRFVLRADAGE